MAVRNIGIAIALRKLSSHGPGLGRRLRIAGMKAINRKGKARPTPKPAKMTSAATGGSTMVAPKAAAMNGPVQGVATKAASAPVQIGRASCRERVWIVVA